jgi:hypothetical protein
VSNVAEPKVRETKIARRERNGVHEGHEVHEGSGFIVWGAEIVSKQKHWITDVTNEANYTNEKHYLTECRF